MTTIELLQKTKAAWPALSAAPAEEKNRLLLAMADALESHIPAILAANGRDMAGGWTRAASAPWPMASAPPPPCRITPAAHWRSSPVPTA